MIMEFLKPQVAGKNPEAEDRYDFVRHLMVAEIRAMAYEVGGYTPQRPISEKVLSIMAKVPRHRFVPEEEASCAYYNHPLPIGHGQTISQP